MNSQFEFGVFTKPWKLPIDQLAKKIKALGFDGIELPVRPGFQVESGNIHKDLPKAARVFADQGMKIMSVAGPTDEATIAACRESGIPLIRVCLEIPQGIHYLEYEKQTRKAWDNLLPLLERYQVALGIQNHCDRQVANAMGLRSLLKDYNPAQIGAVWDVAHNALNGEDLSLGLDIIESHICMINLKNAYWKRMNGPEADHAKWRPYWTTGRHGQASWSQVAEELKRRQWRGPLCLTAEYTDETAVDHLIGEDIAYAKQLFTNAQ